MKDLSRRKPIVKMLSASLKPEEVKDEIVEDVEGLSSVGKAPNVVSMEARWVVLVLKDNFAQQDEGPRRGDLARCPPFLPNAFEGLPSAYSEGAFEEAMLGALWDLDVTYLAGRGNPHTLEQVAIEGQPNRMPTLRGRELCHILAIICKTEEFWRFNFWMKEWMLGVWEGSMAFQ
jgi:hypothetical protein